jgi:DNA polymerase-3 subunit beta
MTDPLSPNQLERLLPALRHVAELVQQNGAPSREDLQLLLLASGLDEDWAVNELERWAKVLAAVRGVDDAARRDLAVRALTLRNVPEAPAKLAVETAAAPARVEPPEPTTLPIQVSRDAIGFGELKPGQGAQTTLKVSGGPGRVKVGSDTVTVNPSSFGPEETALTVTVKGGLDGQVLWDALILESETESVKVDLTARWAAPSIVTPEPPVIVTPRRGGDAPAEPRGSAGASPMKIEVRKADLGQAISTVSRATSLRSTLPILSNILFDAEEDSVRLTATDLDTGIRYTMRAKILESGSLTVPAGILGDVISSLPNEVLSLESGDERLIVRCGKSGYTILTTPADEFPVVPEVTDDFALTLPQGVLREILRQTVFAASKEESRTILMGVLFEFTPTGGRKNGGGRLNVVATDTHRLAYRTTEAGSFGATLDAKRAVIVPAKPLAELVRFLSDLEEEVVRMHVTESHVQFTISKSETGTSMTLVSRVSDGQFPNYEKVIPKDAERKITCSAKEFASALRRVAIVARENAEKAIFHTQSDRVIITAESPEVGKAREEVSIQMEGPDIEIAFNVRYLTEALGAIDGETITLEMTQPLSPGVLKCADNEDWLYVVMPMAV